ncbi:MAG: hypothetical protein FJZ01_13205 [Candidatus Sericytochromatia bacterium]|nr:hypothetical protein [Candidatus Tanganyikabacteria bacterium]
MCKTRVFRWLVAGFFVSFMSGCPTQKTGPRISDDAAGGGSDSAKPTPSPAPRSMITGQVLVPATAIIANNTPDAAAYRLGLQALAQAGLAGAQVSLSDAEGLTIGKPTTSDALGSFGFPESAATVGTFFVTGQFDAAGGNFEFGGIAKRKAGEAVTVDLDVASTLVTTQIRRLLAASKLTAADIDGERVMQLVARVRAKLVREQVPLMVKGSEDIPAETYQLALDDLELRNLAGATVWGAAARTDGWTVSTLFTTETLPSQVATADVGLAGPFAVDKDGNFYFSSFSTGGTVLVVRVRQNKEFAPIGTISKSRSPVALAFGPDGTIHAADFREDTRELRLLRGTTFSAVATLSWPIGGTPEPGQLAIDGAGAGFVAIPSHHVVAKLVPGATGTLFGAAGVSGHKDGSAAESRFAAPSGVAVGPGGECWVADRDNFVLRSISADGKVKTEAGGAGDGFYRSGRARYSRFGGPASLAIRGGTVFVADAGAKRVRRLSPDGMVFTVAGSATASAGDGTGDAAGFSRLEVLGADGGGALYVREARVNAAGNVSGYQVRKIAKQ